MIALTRVSREAYEGLLEDGEQPLDVLQDRYGAGFFMRLQGVLCAMAVRQCAEDARRHGFERMTHGADDLFELVKDFEYDTIFEDNDLEQFKPKGALLNSMLFSMCQAETEDWGDDE